MKKKHINRLATIFVTAVFLASLAIDASAAVKSIDTGVTWNVLENTELTGLTIAEGATIVPPEGGSLTLTVNGVETPIRPGTYRGNIVLTPTESITSEYRGKTYLLRTAIDVENGKYIANKSVAAAVIEGEVTDTSAKDVKITSIGENFNGFITGGDTEFSYSIINPVINLTGNGQSDFVGVGAAILTDGKADVTVTNATITTCGVVRSAVVVTGDSTLHVNDSRIEVRDGILPEDATEPWNGSSKYGMISVPWMLGLVGNCRATNLTENGNVYYNNTYIKAQAWGALSTDQMEGNSTLYVKDCHIETVDSGYGAYADGSADIFVGSTFDVTDYGLIMTGGSGLFTDKCVVNSGRFGVMFHGSADLTIDKGSVFNTKKAVIQVKSAAPTITVDDATLNSESGVILQAIMNDDPNMSGPPPEGAAQPGGDMPGGNMPGGDMPGGPPGDKMAGMSQGPMPQGPRNIDAAFKNTTLRGDIVNAMTAMGDMKVRLENASITGAITTATSQAQVDIDGKELNAENYYYIGDVRNTYCETDDEGGLEVSLTASEWIVEKTSYLTGLTIAGDASVKAPKGSRIKMTVDGAETPITEGSYTGRIVIAVMENK